MSKTAFITGVLALLLFLLVSPSTAKINTLTITSDTGPLILLEKFGFTHTGHVAIAASSVSVVAASQPDPSWLGFFLLSKESIPQVLEEIQQSPSFFCILDSDYIMRMFTFCNLSPPPNSSFNYTYPITIPNQYNLFFGNCAPESSVSMVIHTELFNLDPDGSRDYLSSGQTHLPSLYVLFSVADFASLFYLCHVSKHSHHQIHLFMVSLLLAKAVSTVCAAGLVHYVKFTGTPHGWEVLFFIFDFVRVLLLSAVIGFVVGHLYEFSLIKWFYVVVIGCLFLTRFALCIRNSDPAYNNYLHEWVSNLVEEIATLVSYIVMFYVFRLEEQDERSVIRQEEEDVTEIVVKGTRVKLTFETISLQEKIVHVVNIKFSDHSTALRTIVI